MKFSISLRYISLSLLVVSVLGIQSMAQAASTGDKSASNSAVHTGSATQAKPKLVLDVHRDPNCGCCGHWVEHMQQAGAQTKVHVQQNMAQIKLRHGVTPEASSCHTAISPEGYVFEGHVPAKFIEQFLAAPVADAIGLTVPGMVTGSPGMEYGDAFTPYQVLVLNKDGSTRVYADIKQVSDQY